MLISYETERFGKLYTTMESYYPFRKVKDELTLWYDPNKPRNIKLPFSEIAWALIFIPLGIGSILLSLMAITIKTNKSINEQLITYKYKLSAIFLLLLYHP